MSNKDPRDIIIKPVVSEKSYAAYDNNVYTFVVAPDANKIEIRNAVEQLFGKRVEKVHTINRKGKRTHRAIDGYEAKAPLLGGLILENGSRRRGYDHCAFRVRRRLRARARPSTHAQRGGERLQSLTLCLGNFPPLPYTKRFAGDLSLFH